MTIKHTLSVSQLRRLTDKSVEITFSVSDELKAKYQFQHGQFIELSAVIGGETVSRYYSICTAPYEKKLSVAVKQVDSGAFSTWANTELKEGDTLEVSEPQGAFTSVLNSAEKKHYLLVAVGSGITPVLSILKMVLASESMSNCTLVYGNTSPETTMFTDELFALKERYADRFNLQSVYSQSDQGVYQGRVDSSVIANLLGEEYKADEFFVCGPESMAVPLYESMLEQGIDKSKAHIELFSEASLIASSSAGVAKVSLTIDGDVIEFDYEDNTRSILDIALDYDGDLPYGCQNGSCGACQVKVTSGSVEMEVNYALSQSELDEGYVLLCQARPTCEKVEVDYDA